MNGPRLIGISDQVYAAARATLERHRPPSIEIGVVRVAHLSRSAGKRCVGVATRTGHWFIHTGHVVHVRRVDGDEAAWDTSEDGEYELSVYVEGRTTGRATGRFAVDAWWKVQRFYGAGGVVW